MAKRMCAECETENEVDLQFCSKCGLDLNAFFTLDRVMSAREKQQKKQEEDRVKKEREEKEASSKKSRGGLAGLIGGGK
jgi:hypothetical protein